MNDGLWTSGTASDTANFNATLIEEDLLQNLRGCDEDEFGESTGLKYRFEYNWHSNTYLVA